MQPEPQPIPSCKPIGDLLRDLIEAARCAGHDSATEEVEIRYGCVAVVKLAEEAEDVIATER